MNDQESLYQMILAYPDDDAPRLIYADWLDEHEQSERAAFIRLQVEQARWPWWTRRHHMLEREANTLLARHFKHWIWPQRHHRAHGFTRGFCDAVAMPARVFTTTATMIVQKIPLQELWVDLEDDSHLLQHPEIQRLNALRCDGLLIRGGMWQSARLPNLKALRSTGFGAFANFMADVCPTLQRVQLDFIYRQEDFADFVLNTPFAPLQWLKLGAVPEAQYSDLLRARGCRELLDGASLCHLEGFGIVEQAIGDAGLLHLARVGRFRQLRELNLTRNEIGTTGTTALETFLASDHFPQLKALTLDGNTLGFAGARELADWPGLRTLETLNIRGCEIPARGLTVLCHSRHVHENLLIFSDQGRHEFR